MRADAVIRQEGMNVLIERLGKLDAERIISLIIREPIDYTKWQETYLKINSKRIK